MTRMREGYKNYFFRFFPPFHKIFVNFFLCKSVLYKNFFVYLPIEKYGYTKRPLNTSFLVSSWH